VLVRRGSITGTVPALNFSESKAATSGVPGAAERGSPAEHLGWGAIRAGVLMSPHSKIRFALDTLNQFHYDIAALLS
jgi:hypothetical protein